MSCSSVSSVAAPGQEDGAVELYHNGVMLGHKVYAWQEQQYQAGMPAAEFRYDFEEEERPPKWGWKRIVTFTVIAVVIVVSIFLGGYFRGIEVGKKIKEVNGGNHTADIKLFDSEWQHLPCIKHDTKCPDDFKEHPVLLISLDGFRPDYIDRKRNPSLQRLAECGIRAPYMRPVFPSKTYPNHFTLVTGLWPESHGIVDNKMYDPVFKKLFKLGNIESFDPKWWEAEPVWVTVEKHNKTAASFFWPGSDVKIKNYRPSYFFKYNEKIPWQCRVETILGWLDLPADRRPSFLTMYINEPDSAGHNHGPYSTEVNEALELLEIMLDRLIAGLVERNILGCVNIVIVSDHGMTDNSCDKIIALDRYVDPESFHAMVGATARLNPKSDQPVAVEQLVNLLRCRNNHLLVYSKERVPKRYHYSDHRRIEPIVIDMDAGYLVLKKMVDKNPVYCSGGSHGYDNMAASMRAIFFAHGPAFVQNLTARPFRNTEVYELLTELLNITAQPNNGTRGALHYLLKSPGPLPDIPHTYTPVQCFVFDNTTNNDTGDTEDGCMCSTGVTEGRFGFDSRQVELSKVRELHVAWREPSMTDLTETEQLCLLINRDYVTAFHKKLRLPLWTSFTLRGRQKSTIATACWERDARLAGADLTCRQFDGIRTNVSSHLYQEPLFPPDFVSIKEEEGAVWLLSNSLPMYKNHTAGVRREFLELIRLWEAKYNSMNVVMGPAFDIHGNGIRPPLQDILNSRKPGSPVPIPTHVFAVLTKCSTIGVSVNSCAAPKLDVMAFLLPHLPRPENCQVMNQYLIQHMSTVGDVEFLTGLKFFTDLPVYEAIRLRTQLPEGLWPA